MYSYMYICVHAYTSIRVYVCICVCVSVCADVYMYIWIYVSLYRCTYVSMCMTICRSVYLSIGRSVYLYLWIYGYMVICLGAYMCACMNVCMYTDTYIYTHVHVRHFQCKDLRLCPWVCLGLRLRFSRPRIAGADFWGLGPPCGAWRLAAAEGWIGAVPSARCITHSHMHPFVRRVRLFSACLASMLSTWLTCVRLSFTHPSICVCGLWLHVIGVNLD